MMAIYSKGKRTKKAKRNKLVTFCLILIIVGCIFYLIFSNYLPPQNEIQEGQTEMVENEIENILEENEIEKQDEVVEDADIPAKIGNYKVVGQLVIDKIGVDKNILNICDNSALQLSVAKLYGPSLNEPGNFCICGHNWGNMLKKLSTLKKGDTFYMINSKTKTKVTYKVQKVYTIDPKDLSCLDQNNDGKREVTLITCTPGGAKRVVCKAREA